MVADAVFVRVVNVAVLEVDATLVPEPPGTYTEPGNGSSGTLHVGSAEEMTQSMDAKY